MVIPKTREDIVRIVEICGRFRCPITMRGGGTSQAGQAIGEGIQVDTSKYYNRLLEVNAEERWARVEPGIVLDELNAQLAPLGLRFAPDISTASRATIGGMMANNSAGARSVLYGKTIDHVLEQTVAAGGRQRGAFSAMMPRAKFRRAIRSRRACYRDGAWLGVANTRTRSTGVIRKFCVAWAGTIWTSSPIASKPVNLAKIMVGSEGTLGVVLEAKLKLVPLPKAKAVMVIGFADLLESLAAAPVILQHKPSAVEVMDKSILDHTRQNAALDSIRKHVHRGRPGGDVVRRILCGSQGGSAAALAGAGRGSARARASGYHYHVGDRSRRRRLASGACARPRWDFRWR